VVEVYTDKLVAEIPSPSTGKIIKINYMPEQACLVGKALCEIEIEELVSSSDNKNKSNINSNEEKTDLGIDDILLAEADKRNEILDFTSHKSIYILKKF
jgi:pyruvate/2-oxoglutarate dehydrogenase complex dihydrolipoamide acyltransferase (E2) component